jgi:L-alanine-DL-glutamate epimerase-like enolase superfamily enzyme
MQIDRLKVFLLRVPADQPVKSAVGVYDNRPAILVSIMDQDGLTGWGEIYCNFPPCGAEHRVRLIDTIFKDMVAKVHAENPRALYQRLVQKTEIITVKSGEYGPFAQCIAGIDTAMWDLYAKKEATPLWRLINPEGNPRVNIYASGLGPDNYRSLANDRKRQGFNAFKLKVGFGLKPDLERLKSLRSTVGPDALLMADANQVWDYDTAVHAIEKLSVSNLLWIEEPIRAHSPINTWRRLADTISVDIALGENLIGEKQFETFIDSGLVSYLQPDVIKWGGVTGIIPIIERCIEKNIQYCPHCFGTGIGLIASAHLLAASGGNGWLEVDANENILQTRLIHPFPYVEEGTIRLPDWSGLGWEPNLKDLSKYIVYES